MGHVALAKDILRPALGITIHTSIRTFSSEELT